MKRILTLMLLAASLVLQLVSAAMPVSAMALSAESACLIRSDGELLYEKNAKVRMPMASTTKIMTALVVIENMPLEAAVTVADCAVGVEGSSMYLQRGEITDVKTLLYALLLQSANDSAVALACALSGSVEDFVVLMNEKAEELGLENTHFTNPHGLDDPSHYTTAYELATLTAYAMENSTFFEIASTLKYTYETNVRSGIFVNHNKLLYMMDDCVGVKTGYTQRSGRCLVSATENDGLILVCVTLNAPSDWQDHKTMHGYGKSLYKWEEITGEGELCFLLDVVSGEKDEIFLTNTEDISICVPKGKEIKTVTELPSFLYAPVAEGEVCGRVAVYCEGICVAESSIVSLEGCEKKEYPGFFEGIIIKIKETVGKIFDE